jgi:acyl-CoA reductase-like NAD-dependent aldehyde dehydrogenase
MAYVFQMVIDAENRGSSDGTLHAVNDPATGEVVARVPKGGRDDALQAVAAARAAHESGEWRAPDGSKRARALMKISSLIREKSEELAKLETLSCGKTIKESRGDMAYVSRTFEYFAGLADKIQGETIPVPGARLNYTVREPLGVTVHIAPWNYPLLLACRSVAPALAAGNTVVLKPASLTPLTALKFGEICQEAGLPKGVVNVVNGPGNEMGPALVDNPDVDLVALTGSLDTGREVMRMASKHVTPVTLELGGKSPSIVFDDADQKKALAGVAAGIFSNAGQMCWAGSRLFVHEKIHDEFLKSLVEKARAIKVGPGVEETSEMGPLISPNQVKSVLGYVEDGVGAGAKLACGGDRIKEGNLERGNFVQPTVFSEVAPDMRIALEEIFGPVLCVFRFSSEEEVVKAANSTRFGLCANVYTRDVARAHRVAAALQAGIVTVNEGPISFPQTPFGGYKDSGIGYEQGLLGFAAYSRTKNVDLYLK